MKGDARCPTLLGAAILATDRAGTLLKIAAFVDASARIFVDVRAAVAQPLTALRNALQIAGRHWLDVRAIRETRPGRLVAFLHRRPEIPPAGLQTLVQRAAGSGARRRISVLAADPPCLLSERRALFPAEAKLGTGCSDALARLLVAVPPTGGIDPTPVVRARPVDENQRCKSNPKNRSNHCPAPLLVQLVSPS